MIRLAAAGLVVILFGAPLIGLFSQAWAPFWFGQQSVLTIPVGNPVALQPPVIAAGSVTDVQRFLLARAAGWNQADAIIATAISIAEDGSGNPAALSAPNWDGSRDLGLWQINSGWWPQFGGQAALTNPVTNVLAAFSVYQRQGWCAWSTYETRCGPGHNSAYAAFIERARRAAS